MKRSSKSVPLTTHLLLASKSDASESKIAEGISLTVTNHCKQVETNLACASSDNSMEKGSPMSSTNLSHKDVAHAVSSVLNEEKEKSKRKLNLILHNIPNHCRNTKTA